MVRTHPNHLHYHNPSDPTCPGKGICLVFSPVDAVGAISRTPWQLFWVSSASAADNSLNLWTSAKNYAWLTIHLMQGCWEIRPSYSPGRRRQWHPTPVLLPGKSHGRRSLVGCSPWGRYEPDTTERLHFHFSLSCIGKGNGNPLQCSCLENPRDKEAWWAAVYGVTQSWTRLKWLSSSNSPGASNDWCGIQWCPDPHVKVGPLCAATWTLAHSVDQVKGGLSGTKLLLCFSPFLILFSSLFYFFPG